MKNQKINHLPRRMRNKTAERLITKKVPIVQETVSIQEVEELLLNKTAEFETINYIYAINQKGQLKGVVSIKEIFRSKKRTSLKKLFPKKMISVHQHSHQERIAYLALKHSLKEIPVVDKENHLLGVVPSDTILSILDNEAVENMLRMGGVTHAMQYDDVLHLSLWSSLRHRLPWLIVGLLGGVLASGIVDSFETVLSKNLILAAFIPLIVYMADAVGTQMEAFIIRDLAVDPKLKFSRYFFRQFFVVVLIAALLSLLLYGGGLLFYSNPQVVLVISLALFFAIMSSLMTGLIIPYIFNKLKLDPANASGPVATIIQDLLSIFIYFTIGSILL